ncbi:MULTISPECIES: hypothetical protein [unclassified Bradyrhizobium]|uniref:hypothetical protein n=1 Tax=unclassified Bradyrhizobium TaxID=2631580 RepID=UPI0020B3000B|nr:MULTISPECIES: hypothetical protein [unclassified Bradyrhizobium]MCP3397843.1 hypothetical protein [Bradyrhizobium sp. CCGB20]MCP3406430.1 hypothetical protein [Bradyrhizobium sp. CCGB01]
MTLDKRIALAQRHVDRGRLIIERQRVLVDQDGTPASIDLLKLFEQTQQMFEMDLADLLKRKAACGPQ